MRPHGFIARTCQWPRKKAYNVSIPFGQATGEVTALRPTERAKVLYDSEELEAAHQAAGRVGDTEASNDGSHAGNHYICFVKSGDGHLWELNGGMKGPVDRGALAADADALSERALQLGVRSFMKYAGEKDVAFSIVAMALAAVEDGDSAC